MNKTKNTVQKLRCDNEVLLKIIIFSAIIALKNTIKRQPYGIFVPYSN